MIQGIGDLSEGIGERFERGYGMHLFRSSDGTERHEEEIE
jgi:hypothetical protein